MLPVNEVIRRLESKISLNGECHEVKPSERHQYPHVYIGGRQIRANRLIWTLCKSAIPAGLLVCHTCDNPKCCNLDHLFLGTYLDNSRDKFSKHRQNPVFGVMVNTCKLSESDVREIRGLISTKKIGLLPIAKRFGVSKRTIQFIKRGRTWKQLQ